MATFNFRDAAPAKLSGTHKLKDGYLVTEAFSARTGVQLYRGKEVGLDDMEIVRVYRPEESVRDANSLRSFSHAPITIGHPRENVSDANWKELAVGEVSTEATWKDNKIKLPLIIKDRKAIELVEGGVRELSPGYSAEIVVQDGVTPDGEPYDAIQRNIQINHLAIVKYGRSGSEVRIGDSAGEGHGGHIWGIAPINDAEIKEDTMTLQKVLVDGLSVETTEAGAQAITKLQDALKDVTEAKKKSEDDKDKRIAELEGERDELKKTKLGDADIDRLVQERADLIRRATAVVKDVKTDGLSNLDIQKRVLAAKLGDAAITDKSDAYIEARFDGLADEALARKPDPALKQIGDTRQLNDAADPWAAPLAAMGIK